MPPPPMPAPPQAIPAELTPLASPFYQQALLKKKMEQQSGILSGGDRNEMQPNAFRDPRPPRLPS